MVDKGHISARRVGNVVEYTPVVAPADARRSAFRRFIDVAFGGAMAPALEFIAGEARLTPKQREALKALLEEKEGRRG
jgi:predicted transcriptional regulator